MMLFDLREPVNALSHGTGMVLALPLIWIFWRRCTSPYARLAERFSDSPCSYRRGKMTALVIFCVSLFVCYANSALYHAAWLSGEPLSRLRRLDHVGIYLLIAGTYTPAAWSLLPSFWRRRTLLTVWSMAVVCGTRVWVGGPFPAVVSTLIYVTMGWGILICYRELCRNHSHRKLLPLPLGGAFYTFGAVINLVGWPVLSPGRFGAHELFHFFVIAGSASHVWFMLRVVIPAVPPKGWHDLSPRLAGSLLIGPAPASLPVGDRPVFGRLRVTAQLGGVLFRRPHVAASLQAATSRNQSWLHGFRGGPRSPVLPTHLPDRPAERDAAPESIVVMHPAEP
jgi:hemolysin III